MKAPRPQEAPRHDGDIPAEKENGRWHYRHKDVPAIAKALGLAA